MNGITAWAVEYMQLLSPLVDAITTQHHQALSFKKTLLSSGTDVSKLASMKLIDDVERWPFIIKNSDLMQDKAANDMDDHSTA